MTTRPTGAIAKKLDAEALLALGREALLAEHPTAEAQLLSHGPQPQMMFAVDHGNAAIVNGEGVGAIADENGKIEVHFCYGMTWTPLKLDLERIGYAATEEKIDLAEGIRTFGSRLDGNHYQWFNRYDHNGQ